MTERNPIRDDDPLHAALAALRSEDVLTQNEGAAAVVQMGTEAVPHLLALLKEHVHPAQVMVALAKIGDSRAAGAFLDGLRDRDERVRAYAARGLARIHHPEAVQAALQTLNDAADELHSDQTPSVGTLGEMGLKAAPLLLDALIDGDELTRLHAQRAVELIVDRHYGFQPGQDFPTGEDEEHARAGWIEHGNYRYDEDRTSRRRAVSQLRQWLETLSE